MSEYPYTIVTGKLPSFFEKIQGIGVPPAATTKWLPSIGFKSNNDRSIIGVLKFIKFIDASNKPTQSWREYRDKNKAKTVLANAVSQAYTELFDVYSDANNRSDEDLKNFFKSKSDDGDEVITRIVATFKALSKLADFSNLATKEAVDTNLNDPENVPPPPSMPPPKIVQKYDPQTGVTININIELSLPATTDEKIYDSLFAALKKHILSGDKSSDN